LLATKQKAMRAGAAGKYNTYFQLLAEQLVAAGQEHAVLRIGWEFNLLSWPWGIKDALTYKKFFRQIATTMRTVPGAKFTIDWNVNNGFNPLDGTKYYPGDRYVDTVGVDVYDLDGTLYNTKAYRSKQCTAACRQVTQQRAWDEVIYGGERGLQFWTQFAAQHQKPIALPEWGLWDKTDHTGGGDNELFIEQMHHFISLKVNNVAYSCYFDLDSSDGRHSLETAFGTGGRRFRAQFGS
jgi:beta-mannanase